MSCSSGSNGAAKMKPVLSLPGNRRCADCSAPDPQWASLTFGSIFCIRCSGVHRSLGTTVSRVRSLELDSWTPAQVKSMKTRGNDFVNGILENCVPSHMHKPTQRSSFEELTAWIQAKYVEQRFRPTPRTAAEWARFEAEDARLLFCSSSNSSSSSSSSSSSASSAASAILPSAAARGLAAAPPARRLHTLPSRIKSCDDAKSSPSLPSSFRPSDELLPSAEAETAATPRRRGSAKLTKRDIERGWDSIQSEWRVGETDREELVKQQQLERKRMIDEAKRRRKAKGRLERRSITLLSFTSPFSSSSSSPSSSLSSSSSSASSSSLSSSSLSSSSSYSSAPSTSSELTTKKKSEGRMKRLSRDLTALFSSSTGRKGSSAVGENEQPKQPHDLSRRRSVSVSSSSSSAWRAAPSALSSAPIIMVGGGSPVKPSEDREEETMTLFRQKKPTTTKKQTSKSEGQAKSEDDAGKNEKEKKKEGKEKRASKKGKREQASPRAKSEADEKNSNEKKEKKVREKKKEKSPKMKAKTAKPSGDAAPALTEETHHRSTKRPL